MPPPPPHTLKRRVLVTLSAAARRRSCVPGTLHARQQLPTRTRASAGRAVRICDAQAVKEHTSHSNSHSHSHPRAHDHDHRLVVKERESVDHYLELQKARRLQRAALVGEFAPEEQRGAPPEARKHAHETFLGPANVPGRAVRTRQVLYSSMVYRSPRGSVILPGTEV